MATDLQPWVTANLGTTGAEQHWLIGFSKSGIGGQTLILRHPDKFTLAASWDFPADMVAYDQFGAAQRRLTARMPTSRRTNADPRLPLRARGRVPGQ